ncbi:DNA methyltransferase [Geminocystis sp. GBBB08]|uniref:DNA methyltransferase n=1 Tax=Geminocystis sp. GBBB08 TaxID=2604140 RepID=UPI0027E2FEBD|nr:DNA methyltransferase [Geminocystis sp. GBBB08]MBL1209585.1 site-specific DNA-methyltransferase [Geminocystis sp. GBBB08]
MNNQLFYSDNLEVLRRHIKDESVDLCYIDPPFNSKRNYNQIYNNIGKEDPAQAQAFIDTWTWDDLANLGLAEIQENYHGNFTNQSIDLICGLEKVLGKGSLFAYLVNMTLRIVEIHRVLKPTGSFYLHCDPTASHYLKIILDAIFCSQGGDYVNEISWCYGSGGASKSHFSKKHDIILMYRKSTNKFTFNVDLVREEYSSPEKVEHKIINGKAYKRKHELGRIPFDWWQMPILTNTAKERLGYPTQKPEALLDRIIKASSNENDLILDAFCGCGTTIAVAQKLNRNWIGIDITYQSISLILKRLEDSFGKKVLENITLNGIPKDMESATALALKKDDRTRKEFEKWAVLTYTNNRATINDKKGADKGIDGIAFFDSGKDTPDKIIIQVKSGKVKSGDIRDLLGTIAINQATLGIFITLNEPTKDMIKTAKEAGIYQSKFMSNPVDKISIITVREIIEEQKRLDLKLVLEVLKSAENLTETKGSQTTINFSD